MKRRRCTVAGYKCLRCEEVFQSPDPEIFCPECTSLLNAAAAAKADEALTRELRFRAQIEHTRRYTIERCARAAERSVTGFFGTAGSKDERAIIMRASSAIRALVHPPLKTKAVKLSSPIARGLALQAVRRAKT